MKQNPSFLRISVIALFAIATTWSLHAQERVDVNDVPRTISYQGLLTSSDGIPFTDGQYEITVSLYADGRGDNAVWQDSYIANVNGGVFNVLIGSGSKALPNSDKLSTPLWIGTSVNGAPEMRPLTPMTASPYALNVPDQAITTNKLAAKAVTADKVDMDYIAGLEIDGQQVASNGAMLKLKSSDKISLTYDEVSQTVMIDEALDATGTTGDKDKSAEALAGGPTLWSVGGDGYTVPATGTPYTPVAGDWIGTQGNIVFDIQTWSTSAMRYHTSAGPNTTPPNVEGGFGSVVAAASVGSTIAGGNANAITGDYDAIGGGQTNTINDGDYNVVGGGWMNNTFDGDYNTLSGGSNNNIGVAGGLAVPMYSTIGGGQENYVEGPHNTVGGGIDNQIYTGMATIGGGANNLITLGGREATIAGGHVNRIDAYVGGITSGHDNTIGPGSDFGFIGAGQMNMILTSLHGTIGGGQDNTINPVSDGSFIGGGRQNNITGPISTIGGGEGHTINAPEATISGGHFNTVDAYVGGVHGGHNNTVGPSGNAGFIGGGMQNFADAQSAVIGGGNDNQINQGSDFSFIGGGEANAIPTSSTHAAIGGGQNNVINAGSQGSVIAGGTNNNINGPISTIGGGDGHNINAPEATISGGHFNTVNAYVGGINGGHNNVIGTDGDASFIGGGRFNLVDAPSGAIGGGNNNIINMGTPLSFIGGGEANIVDAPFSTIGGGQGNNTIGTHTTIAGGDMNLTDASYAQTVVGFFNAQRGAAVGFRPNALTIAGTDGPLFIVGNGDGSLAVPVRSNAFEVSYNGHSTVFDNNGQGSAGLARPAFRGARYEDNTTYAWGDIDGTGAINNDFGVANVMYLGAGRYRVNLNYLDPITGVAQLSQLAVTATINDPACAILRIVVATGPTNFFDVYIDDLSCNPVDLPFHFQVMGRP